MSGGEEQAHIAGHPVTQIDELMPGPSQIDCVLHNPRMSTIEILPSTWRNRTARLLRSLESESTALDC